jgi:hypothetical protein
MLNIGFSHFTFQCIVPEIPINFAINFLLFWIFFLILNDINLLQRWWHQVCTIHIWLNIHKGPSAPVSGRFIHFIRFVWLIWSFRRWSRSFGRWPRYGLNWWLIRKGSNWLILEQLRRLDIILLRVLKVMKWDEFIFLDNILWAQFSKPCFFLKLNQLLLITLLFLLSFWSLLNFWIFNLLRLYLLRLRLFWLIFIILFDYPWCFSYKNFFAGISLGRVLLIGGQIHLVHDLIHVEDVKRLLFRNFLFLS